MLIFPTDVMRGIVSVFEFSEQIPDLSKEHLTLRARGTSDLYYLRGTSDQ